MGDLINLTKNWTTFTGMPLADALSEMAAVLPPDAYKAVGGAGVDLTDISPAYLTWKANEVFGPVGAGWTYSYNTADLLLDKQKGMKKGVKDGKAWEKEYTTYFALITRLEVKYRFIDESGQLQWSEPIISNGGSDNNSQEYAVRGALTNALGAAFAKLNWQLPVYMGKVHHNNASEMYRKSQAKRNGNGSTTETKEDAEKAKAAEEKTAPANALAKPAAPKKEAPAQVATPAPAAEAPTVTAFPENGSDDEKLQWALGVWVPKGTPAVPLYDKTFAEIVKNAAFGYHVVRFLTGTFKATDNTLFVADTPERQNILKAANVINDAIKAGKLVVAKKK